MEKNDRINTTDVAIKSNSKKWYSMASFILAASPLAILLIGFLFCLFVSVSSSNNEMWAIWWIFIFLIWIMIPITVVVNIVSVVFGIKGIRANRTRFSWAGIIIILLEIIIFVSIAGITTLVNMPAERIEKQEISQSKEEILTYETFADLERFGLGIYKQKNKGDKFLWDITKPEEHVIDYDGVKMVYEVNYNRKDDLGFDHAFDHSNEGKNVQYDVYRYDNTYIIVTPLWDEPGTLYYWGYIYLCKELSNNVDLFGIGILDPKVVENFKVLSSETYSRKELTEKLGKDY